MSSRWSDGAAWMKAEIAGASPLTLTTYVIRAGYLGPILAAPPPPGQKVTVGVVGNTHTPQIISHQISEGGIK
jgi:hypothetical protein